MKQLLEGLKVLDMTNNYAGPVTGAFTADFGANVIHIERPVTGDDNRFFSPRIDGTSFAHWSTNRGKKSLVLDLKDPRAHEIIIQLAKEADILIQSFRPGVMDRLGFGYEDIKKINPKIIYCSISAYGQTGPYAKRPGYDVIAQAVSGMMYMTGERNGAPMKVGTAVGDFVGGIVAFGLIGTALYYREITGLGQHIDVSLARLLMWMSARFDYEYTGHQDKRNGNHHTTLAPYGVFNGNSGESIIIGALSQKLWTTLCNTMGKPELATDPKFITNDKRCNNLDEVIAIIEDWLKGFEHIKDAETLLMNAGVPCARVYDHKDVHNDPHFNECGWIVKIPAPDNVTTLKDRDFPGDPFTFSEVKPEYRRAPTLGENNHEILGSLGYSSEEIDSMEKEWSDAILKKRK